MNRLVIAALLALPSSALAHPGHSHAGMSPSHHIFEIALVAAMVAGGYVLARCAQTRLSRRKR